MFGDHRHEHRHRRHGWGGWDWFEGGGPGFGPGARRHARRAARMFGQGDLKLVILQLLEEKPRHGYDIIRALEERSGGSYSPSPGTVYPTLSLLEEMDYAKATVEDSGKKIYEITDAGRAYLAEHKETVDDVFERLVEFGRTLFGGREMIQAHEAMGALGRAYARLVMSGPRTREQVERVVEVLRKAAAELDAIA
ncbi:MAG TPA: PadR family transcriptional regulator [Gemmatimonadaceae bacterium]|nr:PadR family transcriptional regulator [Gemmatimonadaceae bacterium]